MNDITLTCGRPGRTSYGWDVGPSYYGPRGIIARPERAPVGNVILRVGVENRSLGWSQVAHVVLVPDEARSFMADIAAQLDADAPVGPQPGLASETATAQTLLDSEALDRLVALVESGADLEGSDAGEGVAAILRATGRQVGDGS